MPELAQHGGWLPPVFMVLMGVAMLVYVVLDGYDLGVGVLLTAADDDDKDRMIASIGPFWDANETWLVLGVGILLTAFPLAHGLILGELYLPVAVMLGGLILRGVAFDFRVKAAAAHRAAWNRAFFAGSLIAAFAQGVMLGQYVTGFDRSPWVVAFDAFVGIGLVAGYVLLGASWLLIKTTGELQLRAAAWARLSLVFTAAGIAAISLMTPMVSTRIFERWFSLPNLLLLAPIPLVTAGLFVLIAVTLRRLPRPDDRYEWVPFAGTVAIFALAFCGLAFSMVPYLVVDRMDIWQAAAAPESLRVILWGAAVVLPMIAAYTAYSYYVFRGKASELRYD